MDPLISQTFSSGYWRYRRLKYTVRDLLGSHPGWVPWLARFSRWRSNLGREDSAICIEGFPRSANTFAVVAFEHAQQLNNMHVARHSHLAGQVIRCIRMDVPTLVVIRNPVDALVSVLIRNPYLGVRQMIGCYNRFHRSLLPEKGRMVIADFDEVTTRFGDVVDRLNRHYGMYFQHFDHSPENVDYCFGIIEEMDRQDRGHTKVSEEHVARPSEARRDERAAVLTRIQEPSHGPALAVAEELYRTFRDAGLRT